MSIGARSLEGHVPRAADTCPTGPRSSWARLAGMKGERESDIADLKGFSLSRSEAGNHGGNLSYSSKTKSTQYDRGGEPSGVRSPGDDLRSIFLTLTT